MNKKELYAFTRPEQPLDVHAQDMANIDNGELLHSIGMTPTKKMRLGAAIETFGLNISALQKTKPLKYAITPGVGSVGGLLFDAYAPSASANTGLSHSTSAMVEGFVVFVVAIIVQIGIAEFGSKPDVNKKGLNLYVKHGSVKKAWQEARTQFPETIVYVPPKNNSTKPLL